MNCKCKFLQATHPGLITQLHFPAHYPEPEPGVRVGCRKYLFTCVYDNAPCNWKQCIDQQRMKHYCIISSDNSSTVCHPSLTLPHIRCQRGCTSERDVSNVNTGCLGIRWSHWYTVNLHLPKLLLLLLNMLAKFWHKHFQLQKAECVLLYL